MGNGSGKRNSAQGQGKTKFPRMPTINNLRKKKNLASDARNLDGSWKVIDSNTTGRPVTEFFELYRLSSNVLGKGSFAEVRLATQINTGESFAIKIFVKAEMEDDDLDDTRREVEILNTLNHPNIVKVYEYYEDRNMVYIVMEYLSGGELFKNIEDLEDFTEKDTRDIIRTLAGALDYCQERGITHRDIKPENILLRKKIKKREKTPPAFDRGLTVEENGLMSPRKLGEKSFKVAARKYDIVLADFGFAVQVAKSDIKSHHALATQCGTPLFIAPEIILKQRYNYKCDVWSVGIVCFMLLSGGNLPFPAKTAKVLYEKVLQCQWEFLPHEAFDRVSDHAKDFLQQVIVLDPKKRLDYKSIIAHPWFGDSEMVIGAPDNSVNFDAMKKFNAKRKVLRAIRARQAAKIFEHLMKDMDTREETPDENFEKYKEAVKLSQFYKNPDAVTKAEKDYLENGVGGNDSDGEAEIVDVTENPEIKYASAPPDMINSAYFSGIEKDI